MAHFDYMFSCEKSILSPHIRVFDFSEAVKRSVNAMRGTLDVAFDSLFTVKKLFMYSLDAFLMIFVSMPSSSTLVVETIFRQTLKREKEETHE